MDERLKFVARLLEGEKMALLCREFDISRKTGHKILNRYKDCGLEGLTDRSRRPYRQANRLPFQIEDLILQLKRNHPTWGAPKIREKLKRRHTEMTLPAISTVKPDQAYRTGRLAHLKREVFAKVFNVPITDKQPCVFVEPGVIEQLPSRVAH